VSLYHTLHNKGFQFELFLFFPSFQAILGNLLQYISRAGQSLLQDVGIDSAEASFRMKLCSCLVFPFDVLPPFLPVLALFAGPVKSIEAKS